jgi:hypothetical protein
MRYLIHVVWLLPLLGAAALGADDLPKPKKDAAAPAPLRDLPGPRLVDQSAADAAELQRLLGRLRMRRETLRNELPAPAPAPAPDRDAPASGPLTGNEAEIARLRKRMDELTARAARRSDADTAPVRPAPLDPDLSPLTPRGSTSNGGAIDPVAVAQNYFRAGEFEAALAAYRKVPTDGSAEQRAPTMYMIATCLRKLGKRDEAARVYREVAAIKGDEFVAECAVSQLKMLDWRKDVESQLADLRARRKALETRP